MFKFWLSSTCNNARFVVRFLDFGTYCCLFFFFLLERNDYLEAVSVVLFTITVTV